MLVIGGLAMAAAPQIPDVELHPDLVMVLFLPPLLFTDSTGTSWQELRRELRPVSSLAVGLVLATAAAVAFMAHTLIPQLPWSSAFVLGAILSPTDAVAASAIAHRLGRVMTLAQGEALVNDASGLVVYQFAVGEGGFWDAPTREPGRERPQSSTLRSMRKRLIALLVALSAGAHAESHTSRSTPAFFTADPAIDSFATPTEPWSFQQETWSGARDGQQHCHELAYPARLRDRIVTEMNTTLVTHGLPGTLPNTVRGEHVVFAIAEWRPAVVVPAEPLVKVLLCSEGQLPKSARAALDASLASDARVAELGLGDPYCVWKREHASGEKEVGLSWTGVTSDRAAAAFEAHGYRKEEDARTRERTWRLGTRVVARELGELWWTGLVETRPVAPPTAGSR